MPYDERTINELQESADMTPVGIQLEVNTDIFNTVHNPVSYTHLTLPTTR